MIPTSAFAAPKTSRPRRRLSPLLGRVGPARREPLADHEAHGDRGVQMVARHMANGVGHRHHGQAEGERRPEHPNAELRIFATQHRAPAAGEHHPERADRFRGQYGFILPQLLRWYSALPVVCFMLTESMKEKWIFSIDTFF